MDTIQLSKTLTGPYRTHPHPFHVVLIITILFFDHDSSKPSKVASGQTIIPFLHLVDEQIGNNSVLRSFLEPCEITTLQTQCTEDEYESNEDCLPQKTDNCNHSKELFCLSGVCLPNCHPHKDTYDHVEGKCFRKVGSNCKLPDVNPAAPNSTQSSILQDDFVASQDHYLQHQSTVFIPDCEKNSVCERGQCRCAQNFTYDHDYNKCIFYAKYAGYCNDTINCDSKSDIGCIENHCQCKSPATQYFHLKRKRCYILIGQVCSSGLQFCPDNSSCMRRRNQDNNNHVSEGVTNISELFSTPSSNLNFSVGDDGVDSRLRLLFEEQRNYGGNTDGVDNLEDEHFIGILGDDEEEKEFICKCDKGFGSTRDKRFCLGLHGSRCNTLHRCNMERGLKCIDGVCLCDREKGNEQIYSEQFQTCITRVGAPCIANGKGERETDICPIGSFCENEKCVCDEGLIPPASLSFPPTQAWIAYSCMKSHGILCKNNINSVSTSTGNLLSQLPQGTDPFELPCNHEIGLDCDTQEGKCLCRDSNQFYDMSKNVCRNFHQIDTQIPVVHFTPKSDREYTFRNSLANNSPALSINLRSTLCSLFVILFFIVNILANI